MTLEKPRIGIVISSIREGRFADRPTQWLLDLSKAHEGATFEIVDLRDFPLPLFNEPKSPAFVTPSNEIAQRFGEKIASFDGYIFVTAEYQHSITSALKNALDWIYPQMRRKPAAFLGYGGVGGARAVEHLRNILVEMRAAPLRDAVHIGMAEFMGILQQGKTLDDFPYLAQSAKLMFEELLWWTQALKTARDASA